MTDKNEELISLLEAGEYANVTRQALFRAIKRGDLKATKMRVQNHIEWRMTRADIDAYRAMKHNREKRKVNGEYLFDISNNRWSVLHASKALSASLGRHYPPHHLYYLIRRGDLRAQKRGGAWVLEKEEVIRLYVKEKTREEQLG